MSILRPRIRTSRDLGGGEGGGGRGGGLDNGKATEPRPQTQRPMSFLLGQQSDAVD
jgi:hypothetical protein